MSQGMHFARGSRSRHAGRLGQGRGGVHAERVVELRSSVSPGVQGMLEEASTASGLLPGILR
eukprot:4893072-Prymnesium_polylepis.1